MSFTDPNPTIPAGKRLKFRTPEMPKHKLSKGSKYGVRPLVWVLLGILVVAVIYPLVWMIIGSFKTSQEIFNDPFGLPKNPSLDGYKGAVDQGVVGFFGNSLWVTVVSIVLVVVISAFAAYPLSRLKIPFAGPVLMFILGGLMLAPTVALVPLFNLMSAIGLYDTRTALVILYVAFRVPFTTFLIRSYMIDLPSDLEEAATLDGASSWRTFWSIILPLCKPILAAAAVLQVIFSWNEFAFGLVFIDSPDKLTLPVGLAQMQGKLTTDWSALFAALVIAAIPVIITFLIGQKQFVRGLTAGSSK